MFDGQSLTLTVDDEGVAELVFDLQGESVNKFNRQTVAELEQALDRLETTENLSGLTLRSGKPAFMVGADIAEFQHFFSAGEAAVEEYLARNHRNFCRLESLPVPVVIAIDGYALGGGLELALACDYRLLTPDARVGLPETRLGIIPGWGGTVRLPRLAGVDTAVEWIASGRQWDASSALRAGVADAVVAAENLERAARHTLAECRAGRLDYQGRRACKEAPLAHNPVEAGLAFASARAAVAAETGPHYPAPLAAVSLIERAAGEHRDEALALETQAFARLAVTDQARALVSIFVNDQLLMRKARQWQEGGAAVTRAAVLGAGIMGGGIACQAALKGVPVRLKDVAREGLDQGLAEANRLLTRRVDKGRMSPKAMGEALNRIEPTLSYGDFDAVDIVVEAVVENADIKRRVLREVEAEVSDQTVLTSNTSTIAISELARALRRPERFCGMHFFNPVYAMPLVEVIRGRQSSVAAVARTVSYATALGKKPVVVEDCPGFLVNRVLFPYFAGFALLVRDGVDYERIDRVMEDWGWPMGPAYLLDVVGLDTAVHAEAVMAEAYAERMKRDYTSATEFLFEADRLGQKSGGGFYDYEPDRKGRPRKAASPDARALLPAMDNDTLTDEQILARMMVPMVTELVRCLDEGVVASPAEADMAMVYGTGFPAFRGGPLCWVDSLGAAALAEMAAPWASLGELYRPPASLDRRAGEGARFHSSVSDASGGEQ